MVFRSRLLMVELLAFALLLLPTAHAVADEPSTQRLSGAWKDALAGEERVLTAQQFAKLNNLAYQAAATRVCDGLEIDEKKFEAALAEAIAPAGENLTRDQALVHQNFVLVEFGTRIGLFIAEGDAKKQSFCANATEFKNSKDASNVWE